jgi:rare lipoprotein A
VAIHFIIFLLLVSFNGGAQDSSIVKVTVYNTHSAHIGIASFYAKKFNGRKTSSGEIFNNDKLTAAHKNLKLGTYVKVRNLKNDSSVIVKINDRLPQRSKRSIDLSYKAAEKLNFIKNGLTKVEISVLDSLKK